MLKGLVVLAIAAGVTPLFLFAQPNFKPKVDSADRTFLRQAAEINLSEVTLGQLAQEKASADVVKQFGQRMITDHTNAQQKLKDLAARVDVTLPDQATAKDMALYSRLAKLSGAEFDHVYINAMVQGHEQAVAQFKKESNTANSADVRTFASNTLPTLEEHLKLAHHAAVQIGATSRR
jgi:putative membrane protein